MKTLSQILVLTLLTLGSCTSSLYTGAEYDDLYYLPSDKPVVKNNPSVNEKIAEGTLTDKDYYDNKYAADTLVADQYADAVDIGSQVYNNDYSNNQGYDYYDNYSSYAGRLNRFYGNYFDPYWRDPFYFSSGFPSFGYSFGFGGFPYSYGFGNPYYGYGGYSDYYGGYYPGYYGGYYPGYYGGYNGGYYGGNYGNYYGGYFTSFHNHKVPYGRTTERSSNFSSRWNSNVTGIGSSRRDSYVSGNSRTGGRTAGSQTIATDQRRNVTSGVNSQQATNQANRRLSQDQSKGEYIRSNTSVQRNPANSRPVYNSVNRSYTPSYNNPRMSTRPSYNNSRVSQGANSNVIHNNGTTNSRMYNNSGTFRTPSNQGSYQNSNNNVRSNSSGNSYQRRSESTSRYSSPAGQYRSVSSGSNRSSGSYSVPSRSSVERSSSYSSGSSSGSSRSYSSGSSGGGSYSSGSSSSGSSSGSSSSSGGGGGRRH